MTPVTHAVTARDNTLLLLKNQNQSPLTMLPIDVIKQILLLLTVEGISAVSLTCKGLHAVSQDNHLWRNLFNRAFSTPFPSGTFSEEGACLAVYKNRHNLIKGASESRCLTKSGEYGRLLCVDNMLISCAEGGTIRIWDLNTNQCTKELKGHTDSVSCLIWADGMLFSGSHDQTIKIWDLKNGKCIQTLIEKGVARDHFGQRIKTKHRVREQERRITVTSLLWAEETLFAGYSNSSTHIWDIKSGSSINLSDIKSWKYTQINANTFVSLSNAFSPASVRSLMWSNGHLISSDEYSIDIRDLKTGEYIIIKEEEKLSENSLICADGRLISGHENGTINIRDANSGQCTSTLRGHRKAITSLLWADGMLFSGSEDHTIKIWDLKTNECLRTLHHEHTRQVGALFCDNGILISASTDLIKIWDSNTGECQRTLPVNLHVNSLIWTKDKFISHNYDGMITIKDFGAPQKAILEEIAGLFRQKNSDDVTHAKELFACLPKRTKNKIYEELNRILWYFCQDLEVCKNAFHDLDGLSSTSEQKAQAVENYFTNVNKK